MSDRNTARLKIAVIGWGSLIWCPGCLQVTSRWRTDGPELPIEFARISSDQRLTLVIYSGPERSPTPRQRSYWAISRFQEVDQARENLRERERTSIDDIHWLTPKRQHAKVDKAVAASIRGWVKANDRVQAAVWTGLASNWMGDFTAESAVAYLEKLEMNKRQAKTTFDLAREYICNTPSQIQTPVRKLLQSREGWKDSALPAVLFE